MAPLAAMASGVMVGPVGPLATISREPGQARKGAAAAVTSCAGVWLAGLTSSFSIPRFSNSLPDSRACFASAIVLQQCLEFTALLQANHCSEDLLRRHFGVVAYQARNGFFLNRLQCNQGWFCRGLAIEPVQ